MCLFNITLLQNNLETSIYLKKCQNPQISYPVNFLGIQLCTDVQNEINIYLHTTIYGLKINISKVSA